MMRVVVAAALLPMAAPVAAQSLAPADKAAIERAMAESAAGWSARDLDRFLGVYADTPDVAFVTEQGIVRGKAAIRERYARGYARQFDKDATGPADRLSFDFQDWRAIGRDHALVIARYILTPAAGGKAISGYTTVLFARTPKGWRIVSDHSS